MTRNGNEDSTVTSMEDNDNAVPVKSRILIQSDWNEGGASWLMVKTPGESSLRGAFDDATTSTTPDKDAADGFSATKLRNTLVSNAWCLCRIRFISPMPHCYMTTCMTTCLRVCLRVHLRPSVGRTSPRLSSRRSASPTPAPGTPRCSWRRRASGRGSTRKAESQVWT